MPYFCSKTNHMNILLILHSILRWAVLAFGLLTVINSLSGVFAKRAYTPNDNRTSLLFMISCDVQLLLGLVLYFNGMWFSLLKNNAAEVMKDSVSRFFAVEHITMMIIAWLMVHVGRSLVKRTGTDAGKQTKSLIFFGIALLIILAMIPWPFRQMGIARELLPRF
jgi:hypothetical protein